MAIGFDHLLTLIGIIVPAFGGLIAWLLHTNTKQTQMADRTLANEKAIEELKKAQDAQAAKYSETISKIYAQMSDMRKDMDTKLDRLIEAVAMLRGRLEK